MRDTIYIYVYEREREIVCVCICPEAVLRDGDKWEQHHVQGSEQYSWTERTMSGTGGMKGRQPSLPRACSLSGLRNSGLGKFLSRAMV